MNSHVFFVFIDWLSSHLSLTLVLNRGPNPAGGRIGHAGGHSGVSVEGWGGGGVDSPSAVALLIRRAKLRGESPPLSPLLTPTSLPSARLTRICVRARGDVHVSELVRPQALLAELCPLSGYHLLWPYYVLVCVGIKGG